MQPSSHILIKTAGRAGSTIVNDYFKRSGYKSFMLHNENELHEDNPEYTGAINSCNEKSIVIHDHTINFLPNNKEKFYGLIIKRRNIFDQAMSMIVSNHTNQYHFPLSTTNKLITDSYKNSLELNIDLMVETLVNIVRSDKSRLDLFAAHNISFSVVYYEDFNSKLEYFRPLNINRNYLQIIWPFVKSPYRASEIISNYKELLEWWNENSHRFDLSNLIT